MKKIRLNENQFNRIVKNCVKKILKESEDRFMAYHICSIGDAEDEEDAQKAYQLYDKYTHNEISGEDIIDYLLSVYGSNGDSVELESVSKVNNRVFGTKGKYVLTYDQYTSAFDVWEKE